MTKIDCIAPLRSCWCYCYCIVSSVYSVHDM